VSLTKKEFWRWLIEMDKYFVHLNKKHKEELLNMADMVEKTKDDKMRRRWMNTILKTAREYYYKERSGKYVK